MTQRLDAALVARGLARSRTQAAVLIAQGPVTVDGRPVVKASAQVADDAVLEVDGGDHCVGRAAGKLDAALDAFGVDVSGRLALDLGASTGGFTQVLLERGAESVIAVDVGHDQLAASVADDPRVIVDRGRERPRPHARVARARQRDRRGRRRSSRATSPSSRSRMCCPPSRAVAAPDADLVLLVKPQFEVGRTGRARRTREGRGAPRRRGQRRAGGRVGRGSAARLGVIASPIVGTHGNREYLVHLAPGAREQSDRMVSGS